MYKIIGADFRHYGPATADQVKQWIAEGRANGQSLAQMDGATDWKPLATFVEFTDALAAKAPAPPPLSSPTHSSGRNSNQTAAGVCGILLGSLGVHKFILGYNTAGVIMLLATILTCGLAGAIMHVIGLIEGILYLTLSEEEFVRIHVNGRKEWF